MTPLSPISPLMPWIIATLSSPNPSASVFNDIPPSLTLSQVTPTLDVIKISSIWSQATA
ncbi:hypothetical protein K443DRAFT_8589 [Laccaria amethystina LaAM-08-1]|uniref:Uncharacterized protein n=1 Tax=Laccaria amethystina LaAM-08-1 TaxID=1095629 RepID=A0A0C9WNN0_9AGAR|nr:hypothetical protein K443DRAFT_8589 [Laccaria amethystina LaAM-08-1]